MVLKPAASEHHAVEAVVVFKRADDFEAESVAVEADDFRQMVGRARDADVRFVNAAHLE